MDIRLKKFINKIIIFTVILAAVGTVFFLFFFRQYYFSAFPFGFIVFVTISIIVHSLMLKASKKSPIQFNTAFMLGFMIKIFIYAAYVGIILAIDKINIKPFALTTLVLYACYTVFDVKNILSDVKK